MKILHQPGEIISDSRSRHQYQIVDVLGRGGVGTTYRAAIVGDSRQVALKVVSLRQTRDWKVLELFEREAKVLSRLNYEFIPAYLDYFELETADDKRFYLVQELVEGKSLSNLVASGWHGTELEIKEIGMQLLDILHYLHSFDPPVIHRDLKPHNIIRRPDGRVYLVDFGAVQDIYRNTVSLGKTFVGTLGYMSLEQLRGDVSSASDLYSLGCTLLFLLTHKSPADLPQKGLSIDFHNRVNISASFQTWLTQITQPIAEDRFQSAAAAKQALRRRAKAKPSLRLKLPADSKIAIAKTAESLQLKIPLGVHRAESLLDPNLTKVITVFIGFIAFPEIAVGLLLIWFLSFLPAITKSTKSQKLAKLKASSTKTSAEKYIALKIDAKTICLERTLRLDRSGELITQRQELDLEDFVWASTIGGEGTQDRVTIAIQKQTDKIARQYDFGQGHLSRTEARWIAQEVSDFIDRLRN